MRFFKKRGSALIIALTVIIVIVIIVAALMPIAANQRSLAKREIDRVCALYAAESGINRTLQDLNASPQTWPGWGDLEEGERTLSEQDLDDNSGNPIGTYEVTLTENPDGDAGTEDYRATSTGYSPATGTRAQRRVQATYSRRRVAIMAKGPIEITGNAEITGELVPQATFSFVNIFRATEAAIEADYGPNGNTLRNVNPPNNWGDGIISPPAETYNDANLNEQWDPGETLVTDYDQDGTWDKAKKYTWFDGGGKITRTDWDGEGVLIVEGDLEITGGTFRGILYVIGNLKIAGNGPFEGTIFVDGSVSEPTTVSGTPVINYDESAINDALEYNPLPFVKDTWKEL